MKRLAFLLALLLSPKVSQAQYVTLFAPSGMNPHFPCDDYLNAANAASNPGFPVLWNSSFGEDKLCLIRFLQANSNRYHVAHIYLRNGAGMRSRTLEKGDYFPKISSNEWNRLLESDNQIHYQSIADELDEIRIFMDLWGGINTQVDIVPALEDNFSREAWRKLGNFIRQRTYYLLIRNPEGHNRDLGAATFLEAHGDGARCSGRTQIANLDGTVLSKTRLKQWLKRRHKEGCFLIAVYGPEVQGRNKDRSFKKGRADRIFKVSSSWADILSDY